MQSLNFAANLQSKHCVPALLQTAQPNICGSQVAPDTTAANNQSQILLIDNILKVHSDDMSLTNKGKNRNSKENLYV